MKKSIDLLLMLKNFCRFAWLAMLLPLAACAPKSEFIGKTPPDLRISPIKPIGDTKLSSFRGKVILLDFWATWCEPCKMLMPYLSKMQAKYGAKGFVALGITIDPLPLVRQFKLEHPEIDYDFFRDSQAEASKYFKVDQLPTTILIDREGKIVYYDNSGFSSEIAEDLDKRVADLVG